MNEILFLMQLTLVFCCKISLLACGQSKLSFFSQARVLLVHYSKKVQSLILLVV